MAPTPTDDSVEGSLYDEPRGRDVGCLGLLEAISEKLHLSEEVVHQPSRQRTRKRKNRDGKAVGKPDAGCSLTVSFMLEISTTAITKIKHLISLISTYFTEEEYVPIDS